MLGRLGRPLRAIAARGCSRRLSSDLASNGLVSIRTAGPKGEVAVISMDDGKMNAFSFEMIRQLEEALGSVEASAGAVVLTGNERCFSAGFDLSVMGKGPSPEGGRLLQAGGDMLTKMLGYKRPLVIASPGHSLALGAIVLFAGDLRIGVSDAAKPIKVGLNEVHIGMPLPRFGVELGRLRLAPTYRTRALVLGEIYSPMDAVSVGYLDDAVPAATLLEEAIKRASTLAHLGAAFHKTKLIERQARRRPSSTLSPTCTVCARARARASVRAHVWVGGLVGNACPSTYQNCIVASAFCVPGIVGGGTGNAQTRRSRVFVGVATESQWHRIQRLDS